MNLTNKELALLGAETIDNKKGSNILVLHVEEHASFADYLVIATANSERQLNTLADEVENKFAEKGTFVKTIEGRRNSAWILMDFGDVIVNLFTEAERERYKIEKIWTDCPVVEFTSTEN